MASHKHGDVNNGEIMRHEEAFEMGVHSHERKHSEAFGASFWQTRSSIRTAVLYSFGARLLARSCRRMV